MKRKFKDIHIDVLRHEIIISWQAFGIIMLAFALTVVGIFASQAYSYRKKLKQLEIDQINEAITIANRQEEVKVYALVNKWKEMGRQERVDRKLVPGEVYEVGQLLRVDTSFERPYDDVYPDNWDDLYFTAPVITIDSNRNYRVRYSVDSTDGWMLGGKTHRGERTDTVTYLAEDPVQSDGNKFYATGMFTVQVPINGESLLTGNDEFSKCSEEMRVYNQITEQKLSEKFQNVPDELADKTRTVSHSHLLIEVLAEDGETVEYTVLVKLTHYSMWRVTPDEYDLLKGREAGSHVVDWNRAFHEYSTIEVIY